LGLHTHYTIPRHSNTEDIVTFLDKAEIYEKIRMQLYNCYKMLKAICPCQNSIVAPQGLKVSKVRATRSERKVLEDNVSVDAMRLKMSQIDLS